MAKKKEVKNKKLTIGLNLYVRIILPTLFPERCSIEEYLVFDDIKKKISIDQEEQKEVGLRVMPDGKTTTWKAKGHIDKDFTFNQKEIDNLFNLCELASRNKNFPNNDRFFKFYTDLKELHSKQEDKD